LSLNAPDWLVARPIAHRGLHDARKGVVENTVGAAEAAIRGGYAIECDVQLSRDGEAVVFHDATLARLTRTRGAVSQKTVAAIQAAPLRQSDERVPTLPQFLAAIAGRTPLICEIKSRFDGDLRLTERVAALARANRAPAGGVRRRRAARHRRRGELCRPILARSLAGAAAELRRLSPSPGDASGFSLMERRGPAASDALPAAPAH
jgi:glycerophosphoryl diester phosphodiesterase